MLSYFIALNWDIKKHYGLPSQQKRKIYTNSDPFAFHPHFPFRLLIVSGIRKSKRVSDTKKDLSLYDLLHLKQCIFGFVVFSLAVEAMGLPHEQRH